MSDPFLPYACQSIDIADREAVAAVLDQPFITRGPQVEAFESEIAQFCGAQYAVAFCNASQGLWAACTAAGLGSEDQIFVPSNTFIASLSGGLACGAKAEIVDIDLATGNIDIEALIAPLQRPRTRGKRVVVPVHFAGVPVDMKQLEMAVCHPDDLIIEDAAHAIGSSYLTGEKVGSCAYSQMTVFSFHPAKMITSGEGGMVTTNDPELYRLLKRYRDSGIERKTAQGELRPGYYEVQGLGCNANMTELQAALGRSQLRKLDRFVAKRQELMRGYSERLSSISNVRMLTPQVSNEIGYHLCVVQVDFAKLGMTREELIAQLKVREIGTQVHYVPLHHHPFVKKFCGELSELLPHAEAYYSQTLTLPLFPGMDIADVERVCCAIASLAVG